jgi:hypothetical protein
MPHRIEHCHVPFDIEPENLDAIIVLPFNCLLPRVELLAFINVLPAGIASPIQS